MPLGCAGLMDSIAPFKYNIFLGTSTHESVQLAGYLPAPCQEVVVCRDLKRSDNPQLQQGSTMHGRIWAHHGPPWKQLSPICHQLPAPLSQLVANLCKCVQTCANLEPEWHELEHGKHHESLKCIVSFRQFVSFGLQLILKASWTNLAAILAHFGTTNKQAELY